MSVHGRWAGALLFAIGCGDSATPGGDGTESTGSSSSGAATTGEGSSASSAATTGGVDSGENTGLDDDTSDVDCSGLEAPALTRARIELGAGTPASSGCGSPISFAATTRQIRTGRASCRGWSGPLRSVT
jgi:hypothetical protein